MNQSNRFVITSNQSRHSHYTLDIFHQNGRTPLRSARRRLYQCCVVQLANGNAIRRGQPPGFCVSNKLIHLPVGTLAGFRGALHFRHPHPHLCDAGDDWADNAYSRPDAMLHGGRSCRRSEIEIGVADDNLKATVSADLWHGRGDCR